MAFAVTEDLDFRFEGTTFIESNSPEVVYGPGYVFKNDGINSQRGDVDYPIRGCSQIYFFHINKSKRNLFFHLMIKNVGTTLSSIKMKGSAYTNREFPLGVMRGQSYQTAIDWLTGDFRYQKEFTISQKYKSILVKKLNRRDMLDGKIEVCSKDYYHLNLSFSDSSNSNRTIENFAQRPADGIILPVNRNTYGRVAAIFEKSQINAILDLESDFKENERSWHINTISKFEADRDLQDQTMSCLTNLSDSSCISNGNYGREYNIDLNIKNSSYSCKKYDLVFASNFKGNVDRPSFTWNCPTLINEQIVPTFTTPTKPAQLLRSFTLKHSEVKNFKLKFIPCGLITAKQQLRLKEYNCE
jgi:hypothetical protein